MMEAAISLDTTGFSNGISKVKSLSDGLAKGKLFGGLEAQFNSLQGKFSGVFEKLSSGNFLGALAGAEKMGPAMGGLAVAAGGVAAAAAGMWNAMSRGKELTILAEQTNLTIPQLMTLEKVVGKVGMSMEDMPAMMGKFNTAMTELGDPSSKTAQALEKIGLSAESFQGKSYYEGLKILSKGMGEAASATDKMAAAQAVFGARKGNLMMPVLKEAAFTKAESRINPVAQIYEESGATFAQFQNSVSRLAVSFQPFFAGMANEVIPPLLSVVNAFESMTPALVKAGKLFGEEIARPLILAQALWDKIGGAKMLGGDEKAAPAMANLLTAAGTPTISTGAQKAESMPALIASSFTKIGAGGEAWGTRSGDAMMGIQREQLAVQQRMANALERQLANERQTGMGYSATTTPLLGD